MITKGVKSKPFQDPRLSRTGPITARIRALYKELVAVETA